jgi:hypothetical protein
VAAGATMKDRRVAFIFLIVFVLLAVLTVLQNQEIAVPEATLQPTGTFKRIYPEMAVLDIQAVQIANPNTGESFTISRSEEGIWTAPDTDGTLDTEQATAIARTVVLLPYERTLALATDTDLAEFGFRPNGILFVGVVLVSGEQHVIAVGDLTATREEYYVLVDDRPEIYLVKRGPLDFLIQKFLVLPLT